MQGFVNWVVLIFPDFGGFLYSKRSQRVRSLLNEYKQFYFSFTVTPESVLFEKEEKKVNSHMLSIFLLELFKVR